MLALRPLRPQSLWHISTFSQPAQLRQFHGPPSPIYRKVSQPQFFRRLDLESLVSDHSPKESRQDHPEEPPQSLSLLEELFPEEYQSNGNNRSGSRAQEEELPRLPLPDLGDLDAEPSWNNFQSRLNPSQVTKAAVAEAFRKHHLAVLVLEVASKSLIESDFRRVAPKGKHIQDWTGPGDVLKVIPGRDASTFEQAGHYFILFPNPAYARTYQNHVVHLQRIAKAHTPTSVESPLPIQPGVIIEGEDAYSLLQDYALCPPSQRIKLKLLYPSYNSNTHTGHVLNHRGYPKLVEGEGKSGRSVLFWVHGPHLTTSTVRNAIAADGRERGLAWQVAVEKLDLPTPFSDKFVGPKLLEEGFGNAETRSQRYQPLRWLLSCSDENEARRFIRAWHRRPFPQQRNDDLSVVHTEFLW